MMTEMLTQGQGDQGVDINHLSAMQQAGMHG